MGKFFDEHKKVLLPMIAAVIIIFAMMGTGQFNFGWSEGILNGITERKTYDSYPDDVLTPDVDYSAIITVQTYGRVSIDLFEDTVHKAVNNFVFLAKDNYYDGLLIHYVDKGSLWQTGDPNNDGSGNAGYTFEDEIMDELEMDTYSVAYANEGEKNTNGSQFFVVCGDVSSSKLRELDGEFTVFGKVVDGKDVVDKICETSVTKGSPEIVVESITIEEN